MISTNKCEEASTGPVSARRSLVAPDRIFSFFNLNDVIDFAPDRILSFINLIDVIDSAPDRSFSLINLIDVIDFAPGRFCSFINLIDVIDFDPDRFFLLHQASVRLSDSASPELPMVQCCDSHRAQRKSSTQSITDA